MDIYKKKTKKKTIKEVPVFLLCKKEQIAFSIKFILKALKKKSLFTENLKNEFLLGSNNLGDALKIKNQLHDTVISKKNIFKYYKW